MKVEKLIKMEIMEKTECEKKKKKKTANSTHAQLWQIRQDGPNDREKTTVVKVLIMVKVAWCNTNQTTWGET